MVTAEEVARFLDTTEPFLRSANNDELAKLASDLFVAGHPEIARQLLPTSSKAKSDPLQLIERLLQHGQYSLAGILIEQTRRQRPEDKRLGTLAVLQLMASGEIELASREWSNQWLAVPEQDRSPVARLANDLIQYQLRHREPVGIDAVPWEGVRFDDGAGRFTTGRLADSYRKRIPPGTTAAMIELVRILPKQGNLWALLGELLNAEGNTSAALVCLTRAKDLLYSSKTPGLLVQHRSALESHQRLAKQSALEAMERAMSQATPPAPAPTEPEPTGGWILLSSRPKVLTVVSIGAVFVAAIATLQIREWLRNKRQPRAKVQSRDRHE